MDPAQALAELTEISSQIECAVLLESGRVVASTFSDEERAGRLASAAQGLLAAAEEAGRGAEERALTQLEAATREGSIFAVREGERTVAAVTGPEPTVGLVFYDLKSCLRSVASGEDEAGKPRPTPTPRGQSSQRSGETAKEGAGGYGAA